VHLAIASVALAKQILDEGGGSDEEKGFVVFLFFIEAIRKD
jgi:hypothetical protein